MKLEIKNWIDESIIYSAEASSIAELLALALEDGVALRGANLDGANLDGANLDGANLDGVALRGASLRGANLDGASLRRANLRGANLRRANLDGASLRGASLDGANLDGASLRRANLDGASLRGASLDGANLRGANLDGANLDGANLDGSTIIETGETWKRYLSETLPALLTAGGKSLTDVILPVHWDCHGWENCPMAAAFGANNIGAVPLLLKPRADQFIRYFDARLIPIESVGGK